MDIRKIIREELQKALDMPADRTKLGQDIVYIKNFTFNKKEKKDNETVWVFDHKSKDYTIRFYIEKDNNSKTWTAKIFIYWKIPTKEFTNAKGKDYEYKFGPFSSYEEMVEELNRKLKNNPLISAGNYLDDSKNQFNKDVIEMMKILKKNEKFLKQVKDKHFDDLKKISNEISSIKDVEGLKKYVDDKAPDEEDKQTMLLILQKLYQLNFYLRKEETESLF